ncbi:MAG: hypothetical protein PWQ57_872 [Desulfovibrionales bacterium]|nr:hypothetical protein [Desulfovibrionales bacterium]
MGADEEPPPYGEARPQEPRGCPSCARLEQELALEREERRELQRQNRGLVDENRELLKANADLRVELAEIKARAAPDDNEPPEDARRIA